MDAASRRGHSLDRGIEQRHSTKRWQPFCRDGDYVRDRDGYRPRFYLAALRISYGYSTRISAPNKYAAGFLIGFYALSATIIIPRFGAASFVAYILIAQLLTSAIVDQFGLFAMVKRPIDTTRLIGLAVIVAGIAIMEIDNLRRTHG